ncbi:MAG: hypothetical protein QOD99_1794, partial [Chthoniobacter sp.]|nr:hypothetical protein [Chthoniobacter sp.]
VMDRLKMRREAAKLVLDLIDAQHDDNERFALLPELIVQCQGFELQKWLIEQLARRHQAHPDDYFIAAASAKVLKENGRGGEALAVLADVAWSSHDEIAPLRELVAEAEELGETAAACDLQKRLVALSPGAESHARAKLADLQEAALDIAAATTEWNRLAKLFPRDGSLLLRAADFSLRWAAPDRAREILRSVCTLDPGNAEAALKLAAIADDAEAVGCYEQILAHSAPDKDGVLSLIVTALHLRESKAIEPNARFVAIRGLGQSLAARGDSAAMRAWLERWDRQTAPAESFLEQYFAGAHARALSQLRNLSTADAADPALRSAWMLLAFQIGDAAMLRSILDDGDATAREELMRVLGEFANSEIAPARLRVVDEVFNEKTSRDIVWQAAVQLASHNRFREAARLGQRVFDGATTLRAPCGLELADWYLRCGGKDKAMETLRAISAEAGDSLQQPVYAALRELFLLLPPPERAQWVERVAQNLDREKLPIHACLAMILLHGLQGDERAAEAEIARLIELRATTIREAEVIGDSGERYWSFVLTTGLQLRLWNLDREAAFLWERALADPASIRLQRGSARVAAREIATRLSALKMESAPGEDAESLARDYLQTTTPEVVQALVSQLESDGALLLASRLARAAWEREPDNVQLLHSFVTTAVSAGDREGMHAATSEKFKTGAGTPARRELTLQGAGFLERTGEADEARKLLEAEITLHPQDIELLEKAAGVDERRGHFEDAETLHRYLLSVDPAHPARKAALANVLAAEKKFSEAIGLLEQIPENGATDQLLAPLYLKSGRLDRVRALGAKFLRAGNSDAVDRSVSALAEAGQVKEALQLLFAASIKTKDSRALFSLEAKFVELAAPEFPSLAKSGLSRLERIARNSPEFIEPLLETESRVGAKLGINLEERFAAEWREGKGAAVAGVKMIELYARTGPEHKLEAVFAQCLAREEIEQVVSQKLASALQAERRLGLRERWLAAIRDRWPENEQFALDHVETLHALGRDEEALAELRIFAGRALVESDDTAKAAPLLAELGDREKACEMFALAIHADPLTRNGALRTEYARQLRAAGKPKEAMELLERANDRAPANFEIAEGLSSFQLEKNQRVPAAKVWKHLARASAEPAQRAKALEQLALVEADHH